MGWSQGEGVKDMKVGDTQDRSKKQRSQTLYGSVRSTEDEIELSCMV